jgi:streptomycin 6-kinase
MTCMTNALAHYLQLWNLSAPQPLAETATSHVYTVRYGDTTTVLKLLKPNAAEERVGAIALRYFDGRGAARLLQADDGAHLIEYVGGEDLSALARQGGQGDEQAAAIIADVLNRLHAASEPPLEGLYPLRRWFRSLFRKAEADRQAGNESLYVRAASLAEVLLSDPRDVRVLHGDVHHENIRHHAGRGWLAFDPKGLVGERTYDAANTFYNPIDALELTESENRLLRIATIFSDMLHIERGRILAFIYVYGALSASWTAEDGGDTSGTLRIAAMVEPHVRL